MAGHLEAGDVGGHVEVRRPLGDAELHLVGGVHRPHVHGVGDLQQPLVLAPVGVAVELDPLTRGVEPGGHRQFALGTERVLELHLRPQRRVGRQNLVNFGRRNGFSGFEVVGVDVPGVPVGRLVVVHLQHVRLAVDRLAAGGGVDQADQPAAGGECGRQVLVLQDDLIALLGQRHLVGRLGDPADAVGGDFDVHRRAVRRGGDLVAGEVERVHRRRPAPERGEGRLPQFLPIGQHLGHLAVRVLVHQRDRAARQNVVELVQQHHLPQLVDLILRVGEPALLRRGGGEELDVVQQVLRPTVVALHPRLGGVGAAVQLEVELADHLRGGR